MNNNAKTIDAEINAVIEKIKVLSAQILQLNTYKENLIQQLCSLARNDAEGSFPKHKWGTRMEASDYLSAIVLGNSKSFTEKNPMLIDNKRFLSNVRMERIVSYSYAMPPSDTVYNNYIVSNGWVYYIWPQIGTDGNYSKTGYLYRVQLNGMYNEKIWEDAVLARPYIQFENAQFYINNGILHFTTIDGKPQTVEVAKLSPEVSNQQGGGG